ncbi:hypothetical protein B0H13DRAFT_1874161 [Mycena leptocephala]|nr:hypothetical protein B0H13DRAFT_1874161 [Mycena leptocephala]
MEVPTGPLLLNWNALFRYPSLDWKASVREWLIGLGLPPTNDFGPLQAVDPSTEGCPVTSAQVVIPSRVYPVPHTSSAPSEVAVPPMHPTLDRLKALANSLSSYPPSSLSHNSDPMLSRASLGLGLGMHTASLGTHTASIPYIPTSVSSSTSVSYPASALYSSSLVFTPDHNQNAFTTPLQGPSLSRRISGPVFPLAPSLGLNGLFLSSNPLENVLVGDIYCLHAHLAIHGLSPQGKGSVYVIKTLSKRPLQRVIQMHKVEFSSSDGTAALRKHLRSYLKRLRRGKKLDFVHMRKTRREQELSVLRSDWPTMVPIAKKRKIVQDFQSSISADTLATFVCGSCSARTWVKDQKRLRIKDFDLSLLRRPNYDAQESNDLDDMESDAGMDIDDDRGAIAMDVDLVDNTEGDNQTSVVLPAVPLSWLDPECVQPPLPYDDPMPFDSDGNFEGILFDPDGIGSDDDGDTVLLTCRTCSSSLKRGKVPRLSIANYNYLVEVETDCLDIHPPEGVMGRREGLQAGLERRDDSADSQSAPGYAYEVLDRILRIKVSRSSLERFDDDIVDSQFDSASPLFRCIDVTASEAVAPRALSVPSSACALDDRPARAQCRDSNHTLPACTHETPTPVFDSRREYTAFSFIARASVARPSCLYSVSGPVNPAEDFDTWFLSPDPLQNILVRDICSLYSQLSLHGCTSTRSIFYPELCANWMAEDLVRKYDEISSSTTNRIFAWMFWTMGGSTSFSKGLLFT